ncbi:MAG: twin-arginine translocation signal domain-containing protein [Caldilineaceae bacterium]|nr:twin-arginine translocation signal domain-containing protein [Caldilineaceae bacterium]
MNQQNLSRRQFLQVSALTMAGAALAACAPAVAPSGGAAPGAGVERKEVRVMLSSWAVAEVPFDQMAQAFSAKRGDVEIKIDSSDDNTKLVAQIASGKVDWSGYGIISPFLDIVANVSSGLIQPMDDLIAVSGEEGAAQIKEDMIPSVRADASFEDKLYIIPYSFENITFNWRNDYFAEIGKTEPVQTWDDWYEAAVAVKEWGKDEEIIPTSFVGGLWTDVGALIASAMEQPYTDEGLLDWLSDEGIASLAFFRKLVDEELTPPHGFDGWFESFQRGKVASVQAQSSRGVWGQNLHGVDKWTTSPIATREAGGGSGTVYWGNGLGVVNMAPHPQEVVDFYVFAFGPANSDFQKAVIQSGKTPVYNSSYDQIINVDPDFEAYKWMIGMRDDVTRSFPVPRNTFYLIQHQAYARRIVEFTDDPNMTAEQCAQLIYDDTVAEIEKQQVR